MCIVRIRRNTSIHCESFVCNFLMLQQIGHTVITELYGVQTYLQAHAIFGFCRLNWAEFLLEVVDKF